MEERNGGEKLDEVMLPGFRFHPTDEELVGFYLKRKIQQRPLSIEIIKQLDIYKYDPWDLPKMAGSGEKEWYFYCPRDRKYRNSARPNRVTGAGFWKATGTDRPIYSSEGSKCIGLKKSLVFYKGRAAKGVKTDWMMHEFRLPSLTADSSSSPKKYLNKTIPANESWAICRIFKKTNATAQRALSNSWVHPLHETSTATNVLTNDGDNNQFCSTNLMLTKKPSFDTTQHLTTSSNSSLCPIDVATSYNNPIIDPLIFKPLYRLPFSNGDPSTASLLFSSPVETSTTCNKTSMDVSSLLLSMSSSVLGGDFNKGTTSSNYSGLQHENNDNNDGYPMLIQREMQGNIYNQGDNNVVNVPRVDDQLGFNPFSVGDAWKSSMLWDTSSCTSDSPSAGYSTTKCYT